MNTSKFFVVTIFLSYLNKTFSKDVYFEVNTEFYGCPHEVDKHEFVAVKCDFCGFNFSYAFDRDFYAPTTVGLYLKILKVCMKKSDFPFCECEYIDLDKYLKDLPGDGIFYFDIKKNFI